jgi:hypothetical protein
MGIIGVLPASGSASRISGLPKFALPISSSKSILQWHVEQMLEVCDEVRISTRASWAQLVQNMNMDVKIIIKEPSTMSDAVKHLAGSDSDTLIIGLPDTYMVGLDKNMYKEMINSDGDVVLGTWDCHDEIKGRVGQIQLDGNRVISSRDKVDDCDYKFMWGTMLLRNMSSAIDSELAHVGLQIQSWIDSGLDVKSVKPGGEYMDIGTIDGIKNLYGKLV